MPHNVKAIKFKFIFAIYINYLKEEIWKEASLYLKYYNSNILIRNLHLLIVFLTSYF